MTTDEEGHSKRECVKWERDGTGQVYWARQSFACHSKVTVDNPYRLQSPDPTVHALVRNRRTHQQPPRPPLSPALLHLLHPLHLHRRRVVLAAAAG